ncbi:MAG TPA: adenosylcobinamide-GDP ribazoletransferase, partial [Dehalococcoidales bacterium]|nr:adenosylcobinamide-GDP ribazoletransferase [Dehalococcoidales bacterium]
ALKFLTILPIARNRQDSLEEIRGSIVYYPLVGLIIGLFLAGLNWLFSLVLPVALANALLLVSLVIITGALHLDGFIDTCDGIAGHKPAEARWQVMHDSRTGAFGVVGAVLLLLLKYVSLNSVPAGLLTPTLIMMPVLGRWAMVFAIFAYPYARPEGLGKVIKPGATWLTFAAATAITLAIGIGIAWIGLYVTAAVTMLGIWVIIVLAAAFFKRMFAGLTGDTYGAINEIAEVGALILITLLAHNGWLV